MIIVAGLKLVKLSQTSTFGCLKNWDLVSKREKEIAKSTFFRNLQVNFFFENPELPFGFAPHLTRVSLVLRENLSVFEKKIMTSFDDVTKKNFSLKNSKISCFADLLGQPVEQCQLDHYQISLLDFPGGKI